jgi:hypothetical protein
VLAKQAEKNISNEVSEALFKLLCKAACSLGHAMA